MNGSPAAGDELIELAQQVKQDLELPCMNPGHNPEELERRIAAKDVRKIKDCGGCTEELVRAALVTAYEAGRRSVLS